MKKVTNKELIDYCNSCGEICSAIHCEYYVECRAYNKKYGSVPYKNQLFRPECYTLVYAMRMWLNTELHHMGKKAVKIDTPTKKS